MSFPGKLFPQFSCCPHFPCCSSLKKLWFSTRNTNQPVHLFAWFRNDYKHAQVYSDGLAALLAPLDTMKFTIHWKHKQDNSQVSKKDIELLLIYLFFNTHFKSKVGLYIRASKPKAESSSLQAWECRAVQWQPV